MSERPLDADLGAATNIIRSGSAPLETANLRLCLHGQRIAHVSGTHHQVGATVELTATC